MRRNKIKYFTLISIRILLKLLSRNNLSLVLNVGCYKAFIHFLRSQDFFDCFE